MKHKPRQQCAFLFYIIPLDGAYLPNLITLMVINAGFISSFVFRFSSFTKKRKWDETLIKCCLLYLFVCFYKKITQIIHQIWIFFCITGVTISPDCFLNYLGDSYCDDDNNFSYCNYDYGDCCLTENNPVTGNNVDNYCESCLCKSNETGYPSTFGTPPPGPPPAGPPGQPQVAPPMYNVYY